MVSLILIDFYLYYTYNVWRMLLTGHYVILLSVLIPNVLESVPYQSVFLLAFERTTFYDL